MSFSVRLAPGVRVRVNNRGVRTSIGPRAARIHLGAGRPGVSTGAGPFSMYQSLGGSSGGSRGYGSRGMSPAAEAKLERAQAIAAEFQRIAVMHHEVFNPARPPVAPVEPAPDLDALTKQHYAAESAGLGLFNRRGRAEAKSRAAELAAADVERLTAEQDRERALLQAELDDQWRRLRVNDEEIVIGALAEAFEDNDAVAAPVGVSGNEVSVVVIVPGPDVLPAQWPSVTEAGNISLRKLTKATAASWYKVLVAGHVMVTVKEALAVAPGLQGVRVVAVSLTEPDAFGERGFEALFAVRFTRADLQRVHWDVADAWQVVTDAGRDLVVRTAGAAKALVPLDLSTQPEIAAVLAAVSPDIADEP